MNKVKAYLISFDMLGQEDTKSIAITAPNEKEAKAIFERWATIKSMLGDVVGVVVQPLRKNAKNAHMITEDYYKKQLLFLDQLEQMYKVHAQ